jgi:hypothetical protein
MKPFKDYATMLEEENKKQEQLNKKREGARKRYEEKKRLKEETDFEIRMLTQKYEDENRTIVAEIREHFGYNQILNKEYLKNSNQHKRMLSESEKGRDEGMRMDIDHIKGAVVDMGKRIDTHKKYILSINKSLEMLDERLASVYTSRSFDA